MYVFIKFDMKKYKQFFLLNYCKYSKYTKIITYKITLFASSQAIPLHLW